MAVRADVVLDGLEGERNNTILAMVIARAWRDSGYRTRLIQDPKTVLASEGIEFPADVEVEILENTESARYVNLARDTTEATSVVSALEGSFPLPEGCEIRLVQSTERKRYLVIPTVPDGLEPAMASDAELSRAAGRQLRNGVFVFTIEAVTVGTTVNIFAEAVGAIVLT